MHSIHCELQKNIKPPGQKNTKQKGGNKNQKYEKFRTKKNTILLVIIVKIRCRRLVVVGAMWDAGITEGVGDRKG